ncbi:TLDc domain-containing protein [Entamoeba marina]
MKKILASEDFNSFINALQVLINNTKEIKDEIVEDVETKHNLNKYNEVVEGNDEDILSQYETWYDQLSEVVINNDDVIKKLHGVIELFDEFGEYIHVVERNNDQIKVVLNRLLEKSVDIEFEINSKRRKELKAKMHRYDTNMYETFPNAFPKFSIEELLSQLSVPMNQFKLWCGKEDLSVIFDSKDDGNGSNNVLFNKVIGKSNLLFISIDGNNNVFGGYLNNRITYPDTYIEDSHAFTFSFLRNGKMKVLKFPIKNDYKQYAFRLFENNDYLYTFGGNQRNNTNDIRACKTGYRGSNCYPISFSYNDEPYPYVTNNNVTFTMHRVVVFQMS